MKRVLLQPAYVLHRRIYRETSFLAELFTPDYGRLTVIVRGVRKPRSAIPGLLQAFIPLLVSWAGKTELMTLCDLETNGERPRLQGESLFAGFYLNELIMRLLPKWDAHPTLFELYHATLIKLQISPTGMPLKRTLEIILRSFEKKLLAELGYGLLPNQESDLHHAFKSDQYYRFIPEQGLVECTSEPAAQNIHNIFHGKSLLAIAKEDWRNEQDLQEAKRLIRLILMPLLGDLPLYSRQLFLGNHKED